MSSKFHCRPLVNIAMSTQFELDQLSNEMKPAHLMQSNGEIAVREGVGCHQWKLLHKSFELSSKCRHV